MKIKCSHWYLTAVMLTGMAMTANADNGLEVTTHLGDNQQFRQGDVISFLVSLDRDAWLTAVYIDAAGNRIQIIPNTVQAQQRYHASLFIPIPPADASYRFTVQPPFGEESLWVFASDTQTGLLPGKTLDNGLVQVDMTLQQIRNQLRRQSKQYFEAASVRLHTRPATPAD